MGNCQDGIFQRGRFGNLNTLGQVLIYYPPANIHRGVEFIKWDPGTSLSSLFELNLLDLWGVLIHEFFEYENELWIKKGLGLKILQILHVPYFCNLIHIRVKGEST